jgi:hypothetical protein
LLHALHARQPLHWAASTALVSSWSSFPHASLCHRSGFARILTTAGPGGEAAGGTPARLTNPRWQAPEVGWGGGFYKGWIGT